LPKIGEHKHEWEADDKEQFDPRQLRWRVLLWWFGRHVSFAVVDATLTATRWKPQTLTWWALNFALAVTVIMFGLARESNKLVTAASANSEPHGARAT